MKFIDYLTLRIVVFVIAFVTASLYADSLWLSLGIAVLVTILSSLILDALTGDRHRRAFAAYSDELILGGAECVMKEVIKVTGLSGEIKDNCLISGDKLVINAVKFGNVSGDEIIRYYNLGRKHDSDEIYIVARHLDRKAMAVINTVNANMYYIPLRVLYKLSKPEKSSAPKRRRRSIKDAFRYALSRANASKYLFTALILGVMSIFTPLKTYYLVMSGVTAFLAVLSLSPIGENSGSGKHGIFSKKYAEAAKHIDESANGSRDDDSSPK